MWGAFGQLTALQYSATASAVPLKYDIIIWLMRIIYALLTVLFPGACGVTDAVNYYACIVYYGVQANVSANVKWYQLINIREMNQMV